MRRILTLTLLLLLVSCDDKPALPPNLQNSPVTRVTVLATTYPLAELARNVGGDNVTVAWWLESGQLVLGFEPSREQVDDMLRAGVVLSGGAGEEFATRFFDDPFNDRRMVRLDSFVPDDQRCPLLWLDPRVVKQAAAKLADRLALQRPQLTSQFRANLDHFNKQLDTLMDDYETRLISLRGKTVLGIGKDYTALARHVGLVLVQTTDKPAIRLSDEELRDVRKTVADTNAMFVLVESDTPPTVIRNIKEQVQRPVITIDSLGSSSSAGRNTYDKLMRYNFSQLYEGWRQSGGI